jgi:hypothetical protein
MTEWWDSADASRYGPRYYDPKGRPMSMRRWAQSMGNERHVGESILRIRGRWYRVSTVWLGLDHSFFGGPPLIFETMIFGGDRDTDLMMWRYSTADEAMRGHVRAVRFLKRNVREARHPQLIHNGRKPTAVGRPTANRKK